MGIFDEKELFPHNILAVVAFKIVYNVANSIELLKIVIFNNYIKLFFASEH